MNDRVRQEVGIHTRLKHPAIVELITFFEDASFVYLVLELCHNGELARYLYATPVSEYETKHCLKMMFGNGMRMELWQRFVDRFKVPKICEYYGSTEGNCSISNLTGEK